MESIKQIVAEMRELGMTQAEIGKATGLSQAYISDIERGERGGRTPADTLERAKNARDEMRRSTDKKSP